MEELYALALALVPDPDVAGDLFLAASDEDDLRSRALRWRDRAGLGPLPERLIVHPLTAEQREQAQHLMGRRKRRRRAILGLVASGLAAGALAVGLLLLRSTGGYTLAGDPAFTGSSIAVTDEAAGLQLSIYQVQATPGQVTVWWAITGSDASSRVGALQPEMMLPGAASRDAWVKADDVVTYAHRKDRVLGRSTFLKFVPERSSRVFLRMLEDGQEKEGWNLSVSVRRVVDDPAAKGFAVGTAGVTSLVAGPGYTGIRLSLNPRQTAPVVFLETEQAQYSSLGSWRVTDRSPVEQLLVYPSLPEGTRRVNLSIYNSRSSLSQYTFQVLENGTFGDVQVSDWKQSGDRAEGVITLGPGLVLQQVSLGSAQRSSATATLTQTYLGRDPQGRQRWRFTGSSAEVQRGTARLRVMVIEFAAPPVVVPVELTS